MSKPKKKRGDESEHAFRERMKELEALAGGGEELDRARRYIANFVYYMLLRHAELAKRRGNEDYLAIKQRLAREANQTCRVYGVTFSIGEVSKSEGPCTLFCINVRGEGRYVVEWRLSKKRGMTSEYLVDLFDKGLTVIPELFVYGPEGKPSDLDGDQ